MWRMSFVAASVAVGLRVDDALEALGGPLDDRDLMALVRGLKDGQRTKRAAALASAVHDIARAVDEASLR
jgi:hypothetical protein